MPRELVVCWVWGCGVAFLRPRFRCCCLVFGLPRVCRDWDACACCCVVVADVDCVLVSGAGSVQIVHPAAGRRVLVCRCEVLPGWRCIMVGVLARFATQFYILLLYVVSHRCAGSFGRLAA